MADCDNKPDYIVLPGEGGGVPGPAGPIGPQGPPGVGELPIPAEDVSVTNPGFSNAQEIFDSLLYVGTVISSFKATKNTYEIGESISALGFSWGLNKTDIISQILTGSHVESGTELGISVRSTTVSFSPVLTAASTFTLTVDDGNTPVIKNTTVNFYSGIYYGDAIAPAVIDSNFILSLTKKLQSGRGTSFTSNAGANTYAWYANKKSLGVATFNFGGFDGGMEAPSTVSFTNSVGHTEDYYVYRSTNPQIGPVSIVVS